MPDAAGRAAPPATHHVVQLTSLGPDADAILASHHHVVQWLDDGVPPDAEALAAATVAVTSVRRGFTREMLDALPALRAVCSWGVGFETLDLDAMRQRGVVFSNTPDVLDDCVADLAWGLLLARARRVTVGDRYVKEGRWRRIGEFPLSTSVSGKRMGILGLGRIGAAIARRGTGFGMDIRYTGRAPHADQPLQFVANLQELAAWSDFLMVACAGGPATRHLVNGAVLRALGPGGIVVNVARGSVIDQHAMIGALASGELGGAALDVIDGEPDVPRELMESDRVVLMPHVGSATVETRARMADLVVRNVDAFLRSGALLTAVITAT